LIVLIIAHQTLIQVKMKKIIIYLLLGYFSISGLFAQGNDPFVQKNNPDLFVHWFYINADQKIDKNKKTPVYVIRSSSNTPKSGKLSEYQKDMFRTLKGGRQLSIGPFLDFKDAQRAIKMYDLSRKTDESMEAELLNFVDKSGINAYYFYTLKYRITERTHKYVLARTAAAVASGDLKYFRSALWEGLTTLNLFIGPFTSQEEAEESKRLYRLEEVE